MIGGQSDLKKIALKMCLIDVQQQRRLLSLANVPVDQLLSYVDELKLLFPQIHRLSTSQKKTLLRELAEPEAEESEWSCICKKVEKVKALGLPIPEKLYSLLLNREASA